MRALRIILGSLLWILAGVLLLLGGILSVTVILLPVGIPLFLIGRRLMRHAVGLFMPKAVNHPVKQSKRSAKSIGGSMSDRAKDWAPDVKHVRKSAKRSLKKARRALT